MPLCSAMMSWLPCLCGSSISTCVGSPRRMLCDWSSDGGPWKTAAMPRAAASNVLPKRRSWRDKRPSCSRRWTSWPVRMPAWDWSWMHCEPSMRLCSVSHGLWPEGLSHQAKLHLPASSPSSNLPAKTTPAHLLSQHLPSVDRTGLSFACLVLPISDLV